MSRDITGSFRLVLIVCSHSKFAQKSMLINETLNMPTFVNITTLTDYPVQLEYKPYAGNLVGSFVYWPSIARINEHLTHWSRDKMAASSQTTLSNALKLLYIDSKFTKFCSQRSNLAYAVTGLDNGLVPYSWRAIIWTKGGGSSLLTHICVARPQWVHCSHINGQQNEMHHLPFYGYAVHSIR